TAQGWYRRSRPPRSNAAARVRRRIAPFLSRRSAERFAAYPQWPFRPAGPVSLPREITTGRQATRLRLMQPALSCRLAMADRNIRLRVLRSVGRSLTLYYRGEPPPRTLPPRLRYRCQRARPLIPGTMDR